MNFKKRLKQMKTILELDTVPEVSINYQVGRIKKKRIDNTKEMAKFIRKLYNDKDIDLRERFIVVLLDIDHQPIGYFNHTIGEKRSVQVDNSLIFQKLLLLGITEFIVSHNHPLANSLPSDEDTKSTRTLEQQADFLGLTLVDHFIIGKDGYYSYDEQGFL